ncbi:MAG: hypothetical protein L0I84_05775, partial [Halomonas subglaciescola]|nr:hypothetical protein [Halomonas subglaciescola]
HRLAKARVGSSNLLSRSKRIKRSISGRLFQTFSPERSIQNLQFIRCYPDISLANGRFFACLTGRLWRLVALASGAPGALKIALMP